MTMAEVAIVERWATRHRRAIISVLRVVLLLWAGYWAVFAVAIVEGRPALWLLCPLLVVTYAAWRWPKGGGLVLIVAGMVFAWSFPVAELWLLLAMPAIMLGLALTLVGRAGDPGD